MKGNKNTQKIQSTITFASIVAFVCLMLGAIKNFGGSAAYFVGGAILLLAVLALFRLSSKD